MKNPILLGQVEVIDTVMPVVRKMLEVDGIYIAGDTDRPEYTVPLAVIDGRVHSLVLDTELAPDRFKPTVTLHGPYQANVTPAAPAHQHVEVVDEDRVHEILAHSLDSRGFHSEAQNVRSGSELSAYRPDLALIRFTLNFAQQPTTPPDRIVLWSRGVSPHWYFIAAKSKRPDIEGRPVYETLDEIILRSSPEAAPVVDEAMACRLDDYLGGEFDIRIGKQAAHAALTHALAPKQQARGE